MSETPCEGGRATGSPGTRPVLDAHFHIIDPRFPLIPGQGYLPEPFTARDYLERTSTLNVTGGAIVSGSFQGFDQVYLLDALRQLGLSLMGVTQLPASVPDEEMLRLHAAGVRAVRFNLYRGGSETLANLERLAFRIHELAGWHAELYIDSKDLPELEGRLAVLPKVTIDHLGMTRDGYGALLRLAEKGTKVKATGFGRVRLDVATALREISAVDPGALVFGTDLPGTRARRSFRHADIDLIFETLGEQIARRVLYSNAVELYSDEKEKDKRRGRGSARSQWVSRARTHQRTAAGGKEGTPCSAASFGAKKEVICHRWASYPCPAAGCPCGSGSTSDLCAEEAKMRRSAGIPLSDATFQE